MQTAGKWMAIHNSRYYYIRRRRVPVAEFRSVPDPTERSESHHLPQKVGKICSEPDRALWTVSPSIAEILV